MSTGGAPDPGKEFRAAFRRRYYKGLDYLSRYLFVLIIYGGGIITEHLLFSLVENIVTQPAKDYPVVSTGLDAARVGIALMLLVLAVIDAGLLIFELITNRE